MKRRECSCPIACTVIVVAATLAIGLLGISGASDRNNAPQILPGDLIFQESKSDQAKAIKEVTGSRYTHCGIIVKRDGKLCVAEAINPVRVIPTVDYPLRAIDVWIESGVDRQAIIKRVREGLSPDRLQQLEQAMLQFQGKPYDFLFQWSDEKIYCSEFVYDSFVNGPKLEVGHVQTFADLPMDGPLARSLIKKRYIDEGKQIDPREKIITPVAVMNDPNLDTVAIVDNGRIHTPSPNPSPSPRALAPSN
jgi:permuted papain-like amidase YaeF/Yiix C92 family enzyme